MASFFHFFGIRLTPNIPCPCLLVSSAACRPNERHPRLHGSGGPAPNALSMDVYTWFSKTGGPTKPTKVLYFDVDVLFFFHFFGVPPFLRSIKLCRVAYAVAPVSVDKNSNCRSCQLTLSPAPTLRFSCLA